LLAAILVLTLMILPTVALTSAAALTAVPQELIAGAAALGLTRKSQILLVLIPAAKRALSVAYYWQLRGRWVEPWRY